MNSFRLALVTWNVGGGPSGVTPGTERLLACARNADVIVVGLQEVGMGRRGWKSILGKALGRNWAYIGGESYGGLRLRVFAILRAGSPVATISSSGMKVGAGFADRLPNKGAIAVEIRFAPSCRVLFIVAHLAANENQVIERQDDWHAILRRLDRAAFISRNTDRIAAVPLFHRYEHVFVLGDLNYRIVPPGTDHDSRVKWVRDCVERQDWPNLLSADQLTRERRNGNVFVNFQEAKIAFAPTFKIDPPTGRYSPSRVPSYCDRVLWHSLPARVPLVSNIRYEPLSEFRQSDHLPVVAEFQLRVPIVVAPLRTPNTTKGLRVVLEFQLVRFIKRRSPFVQLSSIENNPFPYRRIPSVSSDTAAGANHSPTNDEKATLPQRGTDRLLALRTRRHPANEPSTDDFRDGSDSSQDGDGTEGSYMSERYSTPSESSSDVERNFSMDITSSIKDLKVCPDRIDDARESSPNFSQNPTYATSAASNIKTDDSGKDYDEKLLRDMLNRHLSTSSSTDMSSAGYPIETRPTTVGPASSAGITPDGKLSPGAVVSNTLGGDLSGTSGDAEPNNVSYYNSTTLVHTGTGPRKRNSLSRQVEERRNRSKAKKRTKLIEMRMEVHGYGLFLKQGRVYSVTIPKRRNGERERIGESLPAIPFLPVSRLEDLEFRHVLLEFARPKSKVGMSGALPMKELVESAGEPYAFEMALTKYGQPVGTLEACVQLTVRPDGCWVDSKNCVVRDEDGGNARAYCGDLSVRRKARAKTKAVNGKWR